MLCSWAQAVCNKIGSVCITLRHVGMLYLLSHPTSHISCHSKRTILWRFNITSNSKTYLGPHVKCQILTKFRISQQIFINMPNIKFHINLFSASCVKICWQMDGLTAWYHFSQRENFYGYLMPLATIKHNQVFV